jgi:hypothetical protein
MGGYAYGEKLFFHQPARGGHGQLGIFVTMGIFMTAGHLHDDLVDGIQTLPTMLMVFCASVDAGSNIVSLTL